MKTLCDVDSGVWQFILTMLKKLFLDLFLNILFLCFYVLMLLMVLCEELVGFFACKTMSLS